eukprot:COSAG01_NODE_175_length_22996_cov_18.857892_21_plen_111_part_00
MCRQSRHCRLFTASLFEQRIYVQTLVVPWVPSTGLVSLVIAQVCVCCSDADEDFLNSFHTWAVGVVAAVAGAVTAFTSLLYPTGGDGGGGRPWWGLLLLFTSILYPVSGV